MARRTVRPPPIQNEPEGTASAEVTFGSTWRTQGDGPWRVAWREGTGELLAVKDGAGSEAATTNVRALERADSEAADNPPRSVAGDTGEVVVIGVEPDRARLRAAVNGWEDHVGEPNGLAWLAQRFELRSVPAGWYPDPWRPRSYRYRWWDGARWSHQTTRPLGAGRLSRRPEPARRREPVPIFPGQATRWIVAGIALSIVVGRVLATVLGHHLSHSATVPVIALYVLLFAGLGATCLLVSRRFGSGRLSGDFGWRIQVGDLLRGPVVFVVATIGGGLVISPWRSDRVAQRTSDLLRYSETHAPIAATVVFVVSAVIAAPLLEELAFRGALQRSLTSQVGVRWATVLQAVGFGAYHFAPEFGRWNIPNMLGVGVFGLVAGIAATRWRRLGPGIVAHALFNTAHVIVVFTTR